MGAIKVVQTLAENNVRLRHPLEVVIFQNEEGGTIGSAAIARGLTEEDLNQITGSKKTVREGIKFIGGDRDKLAGAVRRKGDLAGYLELHIEQGGIFDQEKSIAVWSKASSESNGGISRSKALPIMPERHR